MISIKLSTFQFLNEVKRTKIAAALRPQSSTKKVVLPKTTITTITTTTTPTTSTMTPTTTLYKVPE